MLLILERGEGIESDQRSICRDSRSRRAYDDSPRDGGVARNGFGGGGGGGGGAWPEYWGGRRTDRDVDWPLVTRDSASAVDEMTPCRDFIVSALPRHFACGKVSLAPRRNLCTRFVGFWKVLLRSGRVPRIPSILHR